MEMWRQCAGWLIQVRVLPEHHRVTWDGAQVCDLAHALRDGFLCLKNIRSFLCCCQEQFGMKKNELFEAFDLFDVRDFAKVIDTLSILSQTPLAVQRGFRPFPDGACVGDDDVYSGLSDQIDDTLEEDDDLYDCVEEEEDEGDEVYEDLMRTEEPETHFLKPLQPFLEPVDMENIFINIQDLASMHRSLLHELEESMVQGALRLHQVFIHYKERLLLYGRYCSQVEAATKHLDKLSSSREDVKMKLEECSMRANSGRFSLRDLLMVPMQRVLKYHLLLQELVKHTLDPQEKDNLRTALDAMRDLAQCVNEVKRDNEIIRQITTFQLSIENMTESLAVYGRPKIDGELKICSPEKKSKQDRLERWAEPAASSTLPPVAAVHALTPGGSHSFLRLQDQILKAVAFCLSFCRPLISCLFIRYSHTISLRNPYRNLWVTPQRLLLLFSVPCNTSVCVSVFRYGFLFDRALLVCKKRSGETLELKELIKLQLYTLRDEPSGERDSKKWTHSFLLMDLYGQGGFDLFFKTRELKKKWLEQFEMALSNLCPENSSANGHNFQMHCFEENTSCKACLMLLRGIFYQGYRCSHCRAAAHKECLARVPPCGRNSENSGPTKKGKTMRVAAQRSSKPGLPKMEVCVDYFGLPPPPRGFGQPLTLSVGDVVELTRAEVDLQWWEGRNLSLGELGWFPCSKVQPFVPAPAPDLCRMLWFAGSMDRMEAKALLSSRSDGTFLVRQKDAGEYAISLKFSMDTRHIKVSCSEGLYRIYDRKAFRGLLTPYKQPEENTPPHSSHTTSTGVGERCFGMAKVRYDFSARDRSELTLREGDTVKILSKKAQGGWWRGEVYGRVGLFPANYVEEEHSEYC
ncbi:hypothetical protein DNTS_030206 [Danionella cerebrum]|uniref:Vav guanine nucleotide exchange factor 1 n=1 Tax=Danionella cerebrum TaxID=2873325 RepID=A0A553Q880_9TELE|nr:hypothetical protein DNTS_030206 [Danionella translucida]